jgi:hypothetical protein
MSEEVKNRVFKSVEGWPISMEEAREPRKKLMLERNGLLSQHERTFEHTTADSCEH